MGWLTEGMEFWPGRVGDTAPFEAWAVEQAFVDQRWMAAGDMTLDFAFLLIAPRDGALVEDVVGAEGIYFNHEQANPAVTVCSSTAADRVPDTPYYALAGPEQLAIDCRMTRGASGGPWLAAFDATTGLGFVIGVS